MRIPIYAHFKESAAYVRAIMREIAKLDRNKLIPNSLLNGFEAEVLEHSSTSMTALFGALCISKYLDNDRRTAESDKIVYVSLEGVPDESLQVIKDRWVKDSIRLAGYHKELPGHGFGRGSFIAGNVVAALENKSISMPCQAIDDWFKSHKNIEFVSKVSACAGLRKETLKFWQNLNDSPDWRVYLPN